MKQYGKCFKKCLLCVDEQYRNILTCAGRAVLALQLQEPWHVSSVRFEEGLIGVFRGALHIDVDFKKGFEFEPEAKVHDRTKREWHHLNFFVRSMPKASLWHGLA